ncbi:MAG: DUF362 domain-containing protein [bacterium]
MGTYDGAMSHRVAFVGQKNYEPLSLNRSIRRAIELCGFDLNRVRGAKVLLKPNMLGAYPPSMGVTTHPAFVASVAGIFKDAGAVVSAGDSPNGVYSNEQTWERTGIRAACLEAGISEAAFEASGSVARDGLMIARAALDADYVVNLPKFKTHGLTIMTLAAKNLYGCINGMQKTALHRECKNIPEFADVVARVAGIVKPALTIIDGIVAMAGNGPSAGTLVELGVIAAGTDVHALDAACCRLVGLDPRELDTLAAAQRQGLWDGAEEIDLAGDPLDTLRPKKFSLPVTYTRGMRDWWVSKFIVARIWSGMRAQPRIDPDICRRCLLCIDACPVAAIDQAKTDAAPMIDEDACIQCFCCHEICPYRAIDLRKSALLRFAGWMSRRRSRARSTR